MPRVKIGTFNAENLFLRYRLLDKQRGSRSPKPVTVADFRKKGSILMLGVDLAEFGPISKSARSLTAKVILANDPDVLGIQEVENLETLKLFNRHFLKQRYPYLMVIDGNDPRQIDVGLLSKFPIVNVTTHQFEPSGAPLTKRTFSRDCLEADIDLGGGKMLTMYVNHFKSQIGGGAPRRQVQATRVADIVRTRFGAGLAGRFVVCGDLNAHYDSPELQALLGLPGLENVVKRLPPIEQWTHYYKKNKEANQYDYLLLSPDLSGSNPGTAPVIDRKGLGRDIDYYQGPRYSGLSGVEGASDHCPVFFDLTV